MKIKAPVIQCCFLLIMLTATGARTNGNQLFYNVKDFGAKADGITLNTKAIQQAIDSCHFNGGGTVYFPAGEYLSGTVFFKSNVTLFLDAGATLKGSTNLDDFPVTIQQFRSYTDNYTVRSLIYAEQVKNIAIQGNGVIDGQGGKYEIKYHPYKVRPYMIRMSECENIKIEGITLKNSPMWVQHYLACENLLIDGITVESRKSNLNNDGIDIDCCSKVRIANCYINSEDDAIVLKSTAPKICQNITITNCVLSSSSNALKCGTESVGGFKNITISNCAIYNTRLSGIALEVVDGGSMNRIIVSDIVMDSVNNPVFIRLGNRARPYQEGVDKPGVGSVQNIMISNIQAANVGDWQPNENRQLVKEAASPLIGCSISGLPGHYIENVTLQNVHIEYNGGGKEEDVPTQIPENPRDYPEYKMFGVTPSYGFFVRHVKNITFNNVNLITKKADQRPAYYFDDVHQALVEKAYDVNNRHNFIQKVNTSNIKIRD